ncbi:hypothetical protein [Pleurocapsa sp. PCC 7319]|uniref:hypothetical protein n=1 Tax=Pleurocapsa sp. PCC 7319 TaxID=118161 RepID=UPI00034DDA0E|nr:hypothetical protein [Pleurocapsa sp. PCC 7319]
MNYLVAVLANKQQAEEAYSILKKDGISPEKVTILGDGYQSADEFGLINPNQQGLKRAKKLAYWLIPFGFATGYLFNLLTNIEIFSFVNPIINHIIGGILGAVSGLLGAIVVGGGVGLTVGSGDALTYRNRLNAGRYIIITKGTDSLISQATRLLRQFEPEYIQGYTEPTNA